MITLLAVWVATAASLVTMGHYLDEWMDDWARDEFAVKIRTRLRPDLLKWIHTINDAFLSVFDLLYASRKPSLDRILWKAVLLSYSILFAARLILYVFRIPVPRTEAMLLTAVVISLGASLFEQALREAITIARQFAEPSRPPFIRSVIRSRTFASLLCCASSAFALWTGTAMLAASGLGISLRTVAAMSLGSALCVPLWMLVSLVPNHVLPVAPLRALASSVAVMVMLAFLFPAPAKQFLITLSHGQWKILTFVAFNLFADAVSLVETRWILRKAKVVSIRAILSLLLLDLVLSAAIYLVLPGIADQNLQLLRDGILLKGQMPWLGILFWSTFATSVLFYLFVLAVLLLKILMPFLRMLEGLDQWFSLYRHPARLVAISMVLIVTFTFAVVAILR